jgi:hypothetical protein
LQISYLLRKNSTDAARIGEVGLGLDVNAHLFRHLGGLKLLLDKLKLKLPAQPRPRISADPYHPALLV